MSVVLITGCRSGIGLATALLFGRRGDKVFATMRDRSSGQHLDEVAKLESLDIEIESLDVTDGEAIDRVVSGIVDREGSVDILINSARLGGVAAAVEEIEEGLARAIVETNLWGPLRLSRAVLPAMRARRSGAIVNVSPRAGVLGRPAQHQPNKSGSRPTVVAKPVCSIRGEWPGRRGRCASGAGAAQARLRSRVASPDEQFSVARRYAFVERCSSTAGNCRFWAK